MNFLLALGVVLAPGRAVLAQIDAPFIGPFFSVRGVTVSSITEGNGTEARSEDQFTTLNNGPFVWTVQSSGFGDMGSVASGDSHIKSNVATFSIHADGVAGAVATTSNAEGRSQQSCTAFFNIQFSIPLDATCSIIGSIRATGSGPVPPTYGGTASVQFSMEGIAADSAPFVIDETADSTVSEDTVNFAFVQSVKANNSVQMNLSATAYAANLGPGNANAGYEFNFTIDFGDEDGDGLLDAWETDGIDFDNDGEPEIDLPAMGANPRKKNLFVELDAHSGVPFDPKAIELVEQAFARAPGQMVDNPDGSDGVILHFVMDETDLTAQVYVSTVTNEWPPEFDIQKDIHFGTPELRSDPDLWESTIEPVYRLIFRYGIWAEDLQKNGEPYLGRAEYPGNDLFIAAGAIMKNYPNLVRRSKAIAGTLMHELGHNLHLHHGGQDTVHHKPNYLSVMNYSYFLPYRGETYDGTPVEQIFVLDYSRHKPRNINELSTGEDLPLEGPPGYVIFFNTAPDGFEVVYQIADADAEEIDWNLSGPPIETGIVTVDLTRRGGTKDSYEPILRAYTDWDKLWYHLTGSSDFADATHFSVAGIEPMFFKDVEAIESALVYDRTKPDCIENEPVTFACWAERQGYIKSRPYDDQNSNTIPDILDYFFGNDSEKDRRRPEVGFAEEGLQIRIPLSVEASEGSIVLEQSTDLTEPWITVASYDFADGDLSGWIVLDDASGQWLIPLDLNLENQSFLRVRAILP